MDNRCALPKRGQSPSSAKSLYMPAGAHLVEQGMGTVCHASTLAAGPGLLMVIRKSEPVRKWLGSVPLQSMKGSLFMSLAGHGWSFLSDCHFTSS
jgi:hypothetical protein